MKKKFLGALALGMLVAGGVSNANAAQVTLIDQGSNWYYKTLGFDLWPAMDAGYHAVDWSQATTWDSGPALFGNVTSASDPSYFNATGAYKTYWAPNTDLALLRNFSVDTSLITSPVTLNVAADNGVIVFLNGQEILRDNKEGYTSTSMWEYSRPVNPTLFHDGMNELAVLAEDHGVQTAFDLKLTADVNPVPVPATALLLGSALAGLAGTRLRRKNK